MTRIDYTTPVETLRGEATDLSAYEGDVLLVVNTASKCGLTPQYRGLQALHSEYAERGLRVLGFPCNQFGAQEPGTAEQISEFCEIDYGVDFAMFAKIDVNGPGTHPLFRTLKKGAPGLLGSEAVKWNFTKFLVGRDGTVLKRFAPRTAPSDLRPEIERAL